jgi:hypothetical protein
MELRSGRACRSFGHELHSWFPNPPTELAVGLARLTTALRRARGGDSPPGPEGPMGPPLPAAGTSGIRQARHANSFRMRSCAFGGQNRQPCEGALACRAGPLRKAVRASGSRTCKCSVLLALRRISSSPGAATSRSRRDKRSAPISSEKWASYSQAPPSAGRRAALAAGGSGGPGAGWRGQRRAGAGTGGLGAAAGRRPMRGASVRVAAGWAAAGSGGVALLLATCQMATKSALPLTSSAFGVGIACERALRHPVHARRAGVSAGATPYRGCSTVLGCHPRRR